MTYFIGIDASTTATKALLIDREGKVVGVAFQEYPYETPKPLWSEQAPSLWWEAAKVSIRQVIKESGVKGDEIAGIGLTGQMHGLVLLDKKGKVLRPAILWNDQRTGPQCNAIRERMGKERFIEISGNNPVTSFTLPKILWVQENEPEIWGKTRQILLPKDYVRYKLTGDYAMDRGGGSGTILFDVGKRNWSTELLETFNIPPAYLPKTYEGTEKTSAVSTQAADDLGIRPGIPLFGGGGDQQASAVGTGAVREGIVSISLGTSGVIFATTDSPFIDTEGRLDTFCHSVPNKWNLMGVMLSAGGSLRWYRDTFFKSVSYDDLLKGIEGVEPGCEGVYFLPYLTGERTPYADPNARGAFVGLTVRHNEKHLTRSVIEGISFGLRDCYELIKAVGVKKIDQVRVTGGGAKSLIWRQILADILDSEIVTVNTTEGAAYGASLCALVGSGECNSLEEVCDQAVQVIQSTEPGEQTVAYNSIYSVYHELYPTLKNTFTRISTEKISN